jgi:hypothetical protein
LAYTNPVVVGTAINSLGDQYRTSQAQGSKNSARLDNIESAFDSLSVTVNTLRKDFDHLINEHLVPSQLPFSSRASCACFLQSSAEAGLLNGEFAGLGRMGTFGRILLIPISGSPASFSPADSPSLATPSSPGLEALTPDSDGETIPIQPSLPADLQAIIEQDEDSVEASEGSSGGREGVWEGDGERGVAAGGA